MININALKIGDVLYQVKENNLAFTRKKIHRVIDGEDWFKYDNPLREYKIEKITILGIIRKSLEGQYDSIIDYELEPEFFVEYSSPTQTIKDDWYFSEDKKYFYTKEEAEVYKSQLEEQAREMDKS